jgi:hypothetical protein
MEKGVASTGLCEFEEQNGVLKSLKEMIRIE